VKEQQPYQEGYPVKEKKPTIVLSVEPKSGEEVRTLRKIEKKNPGIMILYYGGKK